MRACLLVLAVAGCDHVFGLGDPYEDAARSENGSDAAIDTGGRTSDGATDVIGTPSPARIAYFPFDQSLINMADGVEGTCIGGGCAILMTGKVGGSLQLDGASCVAFGINQMPATFTLALWTNAVSTNAAVLLARALPTSTSYDWQIKADSSAFDVSTWSGTNQDTDFVGPGLVQGAWHHLAVTYDGTQRIIYVDGVAAIAAARVATAAAATTAYIGCDVDTRSNFAGEVDEVAIYDGALGSADVATLAGK